MLHRQLITRASAQAGPSGQFRANHFALLCCQDISDLVLKGCSGSVKGHSDMQQNKVRKTLEIPGSFICESQCGVAG